MQIYYLILKNINCIIVLVEIVMATNHYSDFNRDQKANLHK